MVKKIYAKNAKLIIEIPKNSKIENCSIPVRNLTAYRHSKEQLQGSKFLYGKYQNELQMFDLV